MWITMLWLPTLLIVTGEVILSHKEFEETWSVAVVL